MLVYKLLIKVGNADNMEPYRVDWWDIYVLNPLASLYLRIDFCCCCGGCGSSTAS